MNFFRGPKGRGGVIPHFAAILLGALLFSGSFPNLLFAKGFPLLAWFAYIPVFWTLHRVSLGASVFWGALYGYASYGLFTYWLSAFHPLAGLIVGFIYLLYFAALFPLLKLALILFPRRGYILQWILWLAYEYLRTLGFLGFPYGVTGYSQWNLPALIQIADIFGVWGVSALVVFPSAYIAAALGPEGGGRLKAFLGREGVPGVLWLCALGGTLIYGFTAPLDYRDAPSVRIALIQHNTDPWRGGIEEYRRNFQTLKTLSQEALAEEPKPDLVVWSETAFVPRIYWHITYRDNQESYLLVRELMEFLSAQDTPFVIGNDDARLKLNAEGVWEQVDYNAVMLFDRGEIRQSYRKLHLVPFTEHFPYKKQFPWVYELLINADTHIWEKGEEETVFESRGVKFSSPICFEDSFGYLSRNFVRNGAEILVNLSNDAWSGSLPAQMQHLSMAVFRAVENRRSMVRSTASGQTCGVDPNGRILAMAEPFQEARLTLDVPIVDRAAPYTRYGDLWARLFTAAGCVILLAGIGRRIIKTLTKGRLP
jgi:apolipoprotein N-acyltransferase